MQKLMELDTELDKLELSYDICLENGLSKPDENRLKESHLKLREIVRENKKWRKELLSQLRKLNAV
ncbi:TPA: hypothetical protein JBF68_15890 [Legionella pneumophila]|nr:hypothetical protein [Legionella pneumophila]